jgi:outer membrane protein assembly factor BamB
MLAMLTLWAASAPAATLTKLWTYPIGAIITREDYAAVSEDGQTVLALSSDKGTLYCFDAQGNLKWNYVAPAPYGRSASLSAIGFGANGDCSRAYFLVSDGNVLYGVNAQGEQILTKKFESWPAPRTCALSGDGSRLWVGFSDRQVGLDCYQPGDSLTKLWTFFPETTGIRGTYQDFRFISGSRDGGVCAAVVGYKQLYILDASGNKVYAYPMSEDITTVTVSGNGNAVAVGLGASNQHELILLPGRLEPGKAISPLRRHRFGATINSIALSPDASRIYVGLDAMSGTSFVVLDERGGEECSKELGAATERLAISKDGQYLAVVDDIGGENVSFYEYSGAGGLAGLGKKKPSGGPSGPGEKAKGPSGAPYVLASLFRLSSILFFILNALVCLSFLVKKRKTPFARVPMLSLLFILVGAAALALCLGLPAMKKDSLASAADALLLGGVLYLIQGIGLWIFALIYNRRFGAIIQKEQREMRFLGLLESRGQVKLDWLAGELGLTRKALEEMIYQLVAEKRFRGYIDWKEGDLYAAQAKEIKENHCPHCGAEVEMVGKGVVKCPYCGAETFL